MRLLSCRESEESIGAEICGARKRYCIGYNKHSGDVSGKRSPRCAFALTCARARAACTLSSRSAFLNGQQVVVEAEASSTCTHARTARMHEEVDGVDIRV